MIVAHTMTSASRLSASAYDPDTAECVRVIKPLFNYCARVLFVRWVVETLSRRLRPDTTE